MKKETKMGQAKMKTSQTKAEAFVRSVLQDTFHQKVSDSKVRAIAAKIEKTISDDDEAPEKKRA
jgi:hypothetical protein